MATHNLLYWLLIGLVAGGIAGQVVSGKSYGCLANTLVGLAGAFIGGYLFSQLKPGTVIIDGTLDELVVAFVGSVVLLGLLRLVTPRGWRRG